MGWTAWARHRHAVASLGLVCGALLGCSQTGSVDKQDAGVPLHVYPRDGQLSLWHAQVKGSHNSYHQQGDVDLAAWNYSHVPLETQALEQGVRAFELDVNFVEETSTLAVFHVRTVDQLSNCATFKECLESLKAFSNAHPQHLPIMLQVEPKIGITPENMDTFIALVERDLLAVFPAERLITPDAVQGPAASLPQALQEHGWPLLKDSRGKLLLFWDDAGDVRRAYTHGLMDLHGRLMFTNSEPTHPFAGVAVLNGPASDAAAIQAALQAHMLVRTRADSDSVEAVALDYSVQRAALASGAHVISTDYPGASPDGGYSFMLPDNVLARCNPVTAAGVECTPEDLEVR